MPRMHDSPASPTCRSFIFVFAAHKVANIDLKDYECRITHR
jgi:hypothetical protein